MSSLCPTIQSLIALGFEHRDSVSGSETVGSRFVHLDVIASEVTNLYGRQIVYLTGFFRTAREMGDVDPQIPTDLQSPLEAAAWVSYALKSYRADLQPLPDWFVEGEHHWDLIPLVAKQRAYETRPKCYIDRDYSRPLRRNLLEGISRLREESSMTVSFDGRVFSIVHGHRVHEVLASGDGWPSSYRVIVTRESKLPARFTSKVVVVSLFEGYLSFDDVRLGLCEAIT